MRVSNHGAAKSVSDNQARFRWDQVGRKPWCDGEVERIAERLILWPLCIRFEVLKAGLHFHDHEFTLWRKRHNIRPPTIRQPNLQQRRPSQGHDKSNRAARHHIRDVRPSGTHGRFYALIGHSRRRPTRSVRSLLLRKMNERQVIAELTNPFA